MLFLINIFSEYLRTLLRIFCVGTCKLGKFCLVSSAVFFFGTKLLGLETGYYTNSKCFEM